IVQDVTKSVLDGIDNVNVGLMRFDAGSWYELPDGGMILHEVENIAMSREDIKGLVDEMTPQGGTPLSETFLEAGNYFLGNAVDFGRESRDAFGYRPSVSGSRTNWVYDSPVQYQCQRNFVVLLSDGRPEDGDESAEGRFKRWPGAPRRCSGNCLD